MFFLILTVETAGSISMEEGEQFDVIEFDQGDGWTRVRRKEFTPEDPDFIGFVPTSYISIEPTIADSDSKPTCLNQET